MTKNARDSAPGGDSWIPLRAEDLAALAPARLTVHWAVQVLAAVGEAMVEPRRDFSHTSVAWEPLRRAFVGGETRTGIRAALTPADLRFHVLGADGASRTGSAPAELAGRTLQEAAEAAADAIGAVTGTRPDLELPTYEMPSHPVQDGARFAAPDPAAAAALAAWYTDARQVLEEVRAAHSGASPVRCWPHHFDIATLITLDRDEPDAEKARSLGVGLSPGDGTFPEPYFYINPWPRPDRADPAPLPHGHWHREGFFGAVLPAAEVCAARDAAAQADRVRSTVRAAIAANLALLDR